MVKPALPYGGELTSLDSTEETAEGVELAPFGIKIMRIAGSRAADASPARPGLISAAHS